MTLREDAEAWIADDPDAATRAELTGLLDDEDALTDRFSGFLEFGTAGLRGALGAGPNRMNRVVVRRVAAGLVRYLGVEPALVIGYDARHNSDVFARDTAAVTVAAGGHAMLLPRPLATPVLAYAIRVLGADAGVMVTASHNPPQDNGYKVYLGDGSQIVPPADEEIKALIAPRAADVPVADDGWQTLGDDIVEAYLEDVIQVVAPDSPRDLRVVHTALHGVGSQIVLDAFEAAGFAPPIPVAAQQQPDPDFPTVAFPNPEEAGAIDLALETARLENADLVIANDPDADRCAVAVPDVDGWRMLRGDEVGALLGYHLLARGIPEGGVFANSIVSSRLLAAMAHGNGVRHQETLTGFKWISRVPGLVYGYEEALGYCVDPGKVRDKDGVSAALLVAELAATLKAAGRTLLDVLRELDVRYGAHVTDSFSIRGAGLPSALLEQPPTQIAGIAVAGFEDLAQGGELPPTEGVRIHLADRTRIIIRPSGTEPKLKVYLEAIADSREAAVASLATINGAVRDLLS